MKKVTVFYHKHCSDGFTAAWAAQKRFGQDPGVELDLVAWGIGEPLPPIPTTGFVYIADLSFTPEYFERLRAKLGADNVRLLDHHKSAAEVFAQYKNDPNVVFNMEKSGAMLAWQEFFPEKDIPNLVRYVEDRDLWRFALPHSEDVSASILSYPMEFGAWESLAKRLGYGPITKDHPIAIEGHAIQRYRETLIGAAVKRTGQVGRLPTGETALFVNSSILASEIGNSKYNTPETPIVAVWTKQKDGRYYYSLRGGKTSPDLSKLARQYGGGGHEKAAGFTTDRIIHSVELDRPNSGEVKRSLNDRGDR